MLKAYSVVSNNNESFNRDIKANNNWKVLKLPVLIDRLSDMEQDQMTDIRASIHGRGSYQLTQKYLFL
jgi:hypothetical protein